MQKVAEEPRPSLGRLFRVWLRIAFEAFGGGASANLLIRQLFVDKHHWISDDDYVRYRDLSVVSPGSNLLSLVILIGRKLRGGPGVAVSLLGMLLPGVIITMAFTIGFSVIQHTAVVKAILNGLIPATAGTAFYQAFRFCWPLLKHESRVHVARLIASFTVILVDTAAIMFFKFPVVLVVLTSGALGVLIFRAEPIHKDDSREEERLKEKSLEEGGRVMRLTRAAKATGGDGEAR